MGARVFDGVDELRAAVGSCLGLSDWVVIDQGRVDRFTDAVGGRRWLDTDPVPTPGGTSVLAELTLSLVNRFLPEVVDVQGVSMGLNYGANGIRFPAAVPVGSRLRGAVVLAAVDEVAGGVQATWRVTVEIEGGTEPACVVSALARYLR